MQINKGITLQLYPNQKQRDQLAQMFGNERFVWNRMLNMANDRYQNNPQSWFINAYGMNYLLTQLKREYPFLTTEYDNANPLGHKFFACAPHKGLKQEFTLDELTTIANKREFKAVPWIQDLLRNTELVEDD